MEDAPRDRREAQEFADFMEANPTVFHFARATARMLANAGFVEISERDPPRLRRGGKYFVTRNSSALIAFEIGTDFVPGEDGFAVVETHIDANRLRLKPTSRVAATEGYARLGVAVYGGPSLHSWWDRDLGLGGRVLVRTSQGAVAQRVVRLPGVVGSIPSLAPHFGAVSELGRANLEANFVPVLAAAPLAPTADSTADSTADPSAREAAREAAPEAARRAPLEGKHDAALLKAIAREAGCAVDELLELELELFSAESPRFGGLDHSMLYCSRLDDRLCSYTAVRGLIEATSARAGANGANGGAGGAEQGHVVRMVALFDNEEVGSLSRTGGYNKFMETAMGLVHGSLGATRDERCQSAANSLALSADVTHAVNPNYLAAYSAGHMPRLNTGMTVKQLGRFTSEGVDAAICGRVAAHARVPLQRFAPRSDTASGSTIGPMRAASSGIRTIDVGIPVLAMHSIREATGARDVELGVRWFQAFFELAHELTQDDCAEPSR